MFKDKKVVVTGGTGFIGTHYIEELLSRGARVRTHTRQLLHNRKKEVRVVDGRIQVIENIDLENISDCEKLIHGNHYQPTPITGWSAGQADYVIHSAGKICHPSNVAKDFQVSLNQIKVITNVLEASYKNGVKGFLDVNSSTGYPDRRYPITEDEYWDDEPYISYYGYGWMRRYREKLMEHTSHLSDMHIGLARGTAIFGPHDNFDLKTCHVIPALIKRVLGGENPLRVWGSPDVVRDFLYVKDVVKGALLVLEKGESMRPYNLGYGSTITIGEIVDTILKVTGKNPKVEWDNSKPTTIPFRACSTDRISKELGFQPQYTFEEGIEETVRWVRRNLLFTMYKDLKW